MRTRTLIALSALAIVLLAAASTLAIGAARRGFDSSNDRYRNSIQTTCTVPNLPGTVVNVSETNMGGPMMGGPGMGGSVRGGMMRLTADATSVPHGTVSFVATNLGSINHELVILPLPDNQIVGTRPLRDDSTVDETSKHRRSVEHLRIRHRRRHRTRSVELDDRHPRPRSIRARLQPPRPLRRRYVQPTDRPVRAKAIIRTRLEVYLRATPPG